jgi:2-polyprenyl-3-methyl-5-hydroxy-6-metoxy-1,4-benzoquinol methylase
VQAWVAAHANEIAGLRVLDVGCGLGDNAECFATSGAQVTAFDFGGAAVAWAKQRFPGNEGQLCAG